MAAVAFDTLKFANRLKAVGIPFAQAEAEAEVLSEIFDLNLKELATKEDLHREIDGLHKDVNAKFVNLEQRIDSKHEALRKDMDNKFVNLEQRIDAKHDALRKDMVSANEALRKDVEAKFIFMEGKFVALTTEMSAMKWILGFVAAGIFALVAKTFF